MYTVYQVIVTAEDGDYVLSEWQTNERAVEEKDSIKDNYGDGQHLIVQPLRRGY